MPRLISFLTLLLVSVAPGAAGMTLDEAAHTVVLLHVGAKPVGTGFLVRWADETFLVTAEHVAVALSSKADVSFAGANDVAITKPLAELTGGKPWTTHGVADVAVVRLIVAGDIADIFATRALPTSMLVITLQAPPRAKPLVTVGYPLGLGGVVLGPDNRISPLSRESKPASGLITIARGDTKKPVPTFFLDSPSIGGFSGAPVFMLPSAYSEGAGVWFSGDSFCTGLVHGTLSDGTGGKLAAIVPVAYIVQTLEKATKR